MVGYLQQVRRRVRREIVYSHWCFLYTAETNPSLPFRVKRSRMNNLLVYLDYRNGRSRIVTQIRKRDGDVMVCWRERERERARYGKGGEEIGGRMVRGSEK